MADARFRYVSVFAAGMLVMLAIQYAVKSASAPHASRHPHRIAATVKLRPTPASTPDPDVLSGLVTRFYRDLNSRNSKDLDAILSSRFIDASQVHWPRDYGYITDARVTINNVHGNAVNYTTDYHYPMDGGGNLNWERSGTWTFKRAPISSTWEMDNDTWSSVHLVSVEWKDGSTLSVRNEKIYRMGGTVRRLSIVPPVGEPCRDAVV